MTKIRFDCGTATISDGMIQAPSPTLTALLDTLAATLPPSEADAEIAQGIVERIGVGKIVRRDRVPPLWVECQVC